MSAYPQICKRIACAILLTLAYPAVQDNAGTTSSLNAFQLRIRMKKRWNRLAISAAIALISFSAHSQQPAASAAQTPTPAQITISPGTLIQAEMSNDVDAKKAHAGDIFRARIWGEVRSGDKIILPQKTVLVGHVVDAQPRTKDNPESRLTIAFDKAVLKNGSELPLRGVVERVQLSPMAVAAATEANARSYNPGLNSGSTTNIAMPAQVPSPGEGGDKNQLATPGPTNIRDTNILTQGDAAGTLTLLSSHNKTEVKLKRLASIDVRITHAGE